MYITVKSVVDTDSNPVTEFICRYGEGRAIWTVGVPQLAKEYDVEFEIDQPLRVGLNTKLTKDKLPRMYNSEHQTTIIAKIEDVFENNTASLRLGDALILVEYDGAFPATGTWVEVVLPQIKISDTGI